LDLVFCGSVLARPVLGTSGGDSVENDDVYSDGQTDDTLYSTLFARLLYSARRVSENRRVIVLNMNYDPLAQMALNNRGMFSSFDNFEFGSRPVAVLHPHGAVNWALSSDAPVGSVPRAGGDGYLQIMLGNPLSSGLSPALALPMSGDYQGKTCWPENQKRLLEQSLHLIDTVVSIGWRGADDHVVELVRSNIGVVRNAHAVAGSSAAAEAVLGNLKPWLTTETVVSAFDSGFSEYVGRRGSPLEGIV
jgi:hypothetical protein